MYKPRLDNKAKRFLKKLKDKHLKKEFIAHIEKILEDPLLGIKLKAPLEGYSYKKIKSYRIIYDFDPESKILTILNIDHRKDVYKTR